MITFTQEQQKNLLECFGESFSKELPVKLAYFAKKWQLDDFSFIEYYSVNCLFICRSTKYGNCVLKIFGCEYEWYIIEIFALNEYDGKCKYVKAHEFDTELGAILLERIVPGVTLKTEPSLEKRLSIFADMWKNAHMVPRDPERFISYLDSTIRALGKPWSQGENLVLRRIASEMVAACQSLYAKYPQRLLLHGDLHGDNLLLNSTGDYTIVDPHGRIGPPICDLGRFIANEYADSHAEARGDTVNYIVKKLSEELHLPILDIVQAFFVDITLMTCWDAEDGTVDINGALFAQDL